MLPIKADGSREEGGFTIYRNSGEDHGQKLFIYDAAMRYVAANTPTVAFAGEEYGTGSSRDWAAKGTQLLGIKAVVRSFERIHRSNLVGMGCYRSSSWAKRAGRRCNCVATSRSTSSPIRPLRLGKARLVVRRADGSKTETELCCESIRLLKWSTTRRGVYFCAAAATVSNCLQNNLTGPVIAGPFAFDSNCWSNASTYIYLYLPSSVTDGTSLHPLIAWSAPVGHTYACHAVPAGWGCFIGRVDGFGHSGHQLCCRLGHLDSAASLTGGAGHYWLGARLLWQGASGGAPIGRPLWVCSAVVLAIYAVFAALPVSQAEAIEQAQSWLVIAVNLLLSITLLIVSIDVKHPAGQGWPAASAERSGSLQLRSNAGVLIMLAGLALIAAIVSRGLLSLAGRRPMPCPAGMLLCCAVPRPGWIRATLQAGRAAGRCAA